MPTFQTHTPTHSPTQTAASHGLPALFQGAAFATLDSVGWVRVTGEDRVRWLNGMVTNSIQSLRPGAGCYNFVLNAQGRIQGDLIAWMLEESILLETGRPIELAAWLERYIIMDDVELAVLSSSAAQRDVEAPLADFPATPNTRKGLLVAGPNAPAVLTNLLAGIALPGQLYFSSTAWQSAALEVFHAPSPLVPRFELWSHNGEVMDNIAAALLGDNIPQALAEELEHLRILEGTPLYGTDIRDKELAQETAQTRALHFSKGCYLGQEIVERIHSRGAVHRTFSGFELTGDLPTAGTRLFASDAPDHPIGEITSAACILLANGPAKLALGYIRRDVLERKVPFLYAGGSALAANLPFAIDTRGEPALPEIASESSAATHQPSLKQ